MCQWSTTVALEVTIPADLSWTGEARRKVVGIDSCIVELVRALNDGGVTTRGSCCGHGNTLGSIILGDGPRLLIASNAAVANATELAFKNICGEPSKLDQLISLARHADDCGVRVFPPQSQRCTCGLTGLIDWVDTMCRPPLEEPETSPEPVHPTRLLRAHASWLP